MLCVLCCALLWSAVICGVVLYCLTCRYISDLDQLKNFGACLHLCPKPPAAVIVDNLSQLTRNTRQAK